MLWIPIFLSFSNDVLVFTIGRSPLNFRFQPEIVFINLLIVAEFLRFKSPSGTLVGWSFLIQDQINGIGVGHRIQVSTEDRRLTLFNLLIDLPYISIYPSIDSINNELAYEFHYQVCLKVFHIVISRIIVKVGIKYVQNSVSIHFLAHIVIVSSKETIRLGLGDEVPICL